ncbi:MAG: RNA methyltransferase [Rhodocyclaceae bacterium]|nr:RNA methyltransferase [Rhodocyclaceae bacterium]
MLRTLLESDGVCCAPMETVRSRRNPLLQQVRALFEHARERRRSGLAVLDGEHLVQDWLAAQQPVARLLLAASRAAEAGRWRGAGADLVLVDDDCLAAVSPAATPAGLLAVVPVPACHPLTQGSVLVLDAVQDPGNVGALLRVAAACGLDQAWLGPGCADAWSWKALRAGQGAHAALPVWQGADLTQALDAYTGRVAALVPREGLPLFDADLRGDVALLLGGEGAGLGAAALQRADVRITIPMPGRAESLNVAMAGAIALYERVRQSSASD